MEWSKIYTWFLQTAAKGPIAIWKMMGFNGWAAKAENKISEYAEAQANGEDTPDAKRVKWAFWGFVTIVLFFIALKIKNLIKK